MIIYDGQVADNYMYQDSNQAAIVVSHSTPSLPYPFTMKPNNHSTETNTPPAIDVEKFVAKLESITSRRSKARCARSILSLLVPMLKIIRLQHLIGAIPSRKLAIKK